VDALYLTIIGVLLGAMFTMIAAWWKSREEARGWKVSYEREKERSDRQDRAVERAALATDIANKMAAGLRVVMSEHSGGGQ
jgi:hypothetical protein